VSSKVAGSLKDTGIMAGGIAIGGNKGNQGLTVQILFDWEPGEKSGGWPPGGFKILKGGTGQTRRRRDGKIDRGEIYRKFEEKVYSDIKDFLKDVQNYDPTIETPLNGDSLKILEGQGQPWTPPHSPQHPLPQAEHQRIETSPVLDGSDNKNPQDQGDEKKTDEESGMAVSHPQQAFTGSAVDIAEPPQRVKATVLRSIRDSAKARELKEIYNYRCQVCDTKIEVRPNNYYVEVHHVRPLGGKHEGLDRTDNMLVLCPNHHAMFDFGIPRFISEKEIVIHESRFELNHKHQLARENIDHHNKIRVI
jgi:hypothetical protein